MAVFTIFDPAKAAVALAPTGNLPAVLTPQKRPEAYTPSIDSVRDAFVLARNLERRFELLLQGKGKNVDDLPEVKRWKAGMPFLNGYLPMLVSTTGAAAFMMAHQPLLAALSAGVAVAMPAYAFAMRWYANEKALLAAKQLVFAQADVDAVERVTAPVMSRGDALSRVVAESIVARRADKAVKSDAASEATRAELVALTAEAPIVGGAVTKTTDKLLELARTLHRLERRAWLDLGDVDGLEAQLLRLTPIERAAVNPEVERVFFDENETLRQKASPAAVARLAAAVHDVPYLERLAEPVAAIPPPAQEERAQ